MAGREALHWRVVTSSSASGVTNCPLVLGTMQRNELSSRAPSSSLSENEYRVMTVSASGSLPGVQFTATSFGMALGNVVQ